MMTIAVREARARFGELMDLLESGEEIVLTEGGEGRFVIHPVDDFEREVVSLSSNAEFRSYLRACREEGEREGRVTLDDVLRLCAESVTEAGSC